MRGTVTRSTSQGVRWLTEKYDESVRVCLLSEGQKWSRGPITVSLVVLAREAVDSVAQRWQTPQHRTRVLTVRPYKSMLGPMC